MPVPSGFKKRVVHVFVRLQTGSVPCPPVSEKRAGAGARPDSLNPAVFAAVTGRLFPNYRTLLTVATTFSAVMPNFLKRTEAGALAPKPCIVT